MTAAALRRAGRVLTAAVAAAIGALLAVAILRLAGPIDRPRLLVVLAGVSVVFWSLAAATLRPPRPAAARAVGPAPSRPPAPTWYAAAEQDQRRRVASPAPATSPPVAPSTTPRRPVTTPPRTERVPLRPGARPADPVQIVQCPHCGSFEIGLAGHGPAFEAGCRGCGQRWRWSAGTPWPLTVIRPR